MTKNLEQKYRPFIFAVSILILTIVILLSEIRMPNMTPLNFLPPIYATINGITAVLLVFALVAIKRKNIALHKKLMTTSIIFSVMFLVMYVAYHGTSDPTPFGGTGFIKYVYYFILITHVCCSMAIVPMVLITYVRGISNDIAKHRRLAKITFPIWLYIAVTGVLVYILISPYYA